jgi:hypothetical protein
MLTVYDDTVRPFVDAAGDELLVLDADTVDVEIRHRYGSLTDRMVWICERI